MNARRRSAQVTDIPPCGYQSKQCLQIRQSLLRIRSGEAHQDRWPTDPATLALFDSQPCYVARTPLHIHSHALSIALYTCTGFSASLNRCKLSVKHDLNQNVRTLILACIVDVNMSSALQPSAQQTRALLVLAMEASISKARSFRWTVLCTMAPCLASGPSRLHGSGSSSYNRRRPFRRAKAANGVRQRVGVRRPNLGYGAFAELVDARVAGSCLRSSIVADVCGRGGGLIEGDDLVECAG